MKTAVTALLLLATMTGFAQTQTSEERSVNDLVGSWRNGSGAGLDIMDSTTVYVVCGDKRKLATASLSDVRRNPVRFNLTVKDSSKVTTLKGYLMVVNDDVLQWQVFDTESKPASYTYANRSDMVFLKRINRLIN